MSVYNIDGNIIDNVFDIDGNLIDNVFDVDGNYISTEWNPVALHGKLRKLGNYLVDKNSANYQLRGIGTHALTQYSNLHTLDAFQCLKDNGINCIRISVYLSDFSFKYSDGQRYYGYISHPTETKAEIEKIVNLCVQLGMYCILDWHTMSSEVTDGVIAYQTEAVDFFEYYAEKYANVPNVLYELQNEPYNASEGAEGSLATYVKAEHDAILQYVDDPVMIVGSRGGAINRTVACIESVGIYDVFYSDHIYSDDLSVYTFNGYGNIPYIMTEWSNASEAGTATGDNPNVNGFMDRMYAKKISNCAWKFTDQTHVFSVLKNRGSINSPYYANGFTTDDLTAWGTLFFANNRRYKTLAP